MYRAINPERELELLEDSFGDNALCTLIVEEQYQPYLHSIALYKARYDFRLMGLLRR